MISVRFFASLRERLQCSELALESTDLLRVSDVLEQLSTQYPQWRQALALPNLMSAVNNTLATAETALVDGDEVAFFPPVTGG